MKWNMPELIFNFADKCLLSDWLFLGFFSSPLFLWGFFNTDLSTNWWHNVISRLELVITCLMKYISTEICCFLDAKTFCRGAGVDEWGVFYIPGRGLWLCLIWKPDWELDLSISEIDVSTQFHTLPFEKFLFSFQDHMKKLENLHSFGMELFRSHPASSDWDLFSHKWLCQISRKGCRATAVVLFLRSYLSLSL